jgi:hypothetical protein
MLLEPRTTTSEKAIAMISTDKARFDQAPWLELQSLGQLRRGGLIFGFDLSVQPHHFVVHSPRTRE